MHPVLRLFLDPIRDNGVAVMFFIVLLLVLAGMLFDIMRGY